MDSGIVYILTNEAMPGYVKIGLTRATDMSQRLGQLDNTSLPVPFECYYAARVPDCAKLERTLHFVFGEHRARKNREFFRVRPDLAKAIIQLVAIEEVTLSDAEQQIDPESRGQIEQIRRRRANRTFEELNVPIGATLTFAKDQTITCEVSTPRSVIFQGQSMSVTAAALTAIRSMGYDWRHCNGWEYWEYQGRALASIGTEVGAEEL